MASIRDPQKRPLYVDRKNGRFFEEPALGTPWKEVSVGGVYQPGDGLVLNDTHFAVALKENAGLAFDLGEIELAVKANSGLALDGGELTTDLKANGGLTLESGELAVDLGASAITGTLATGDGGTGQTTYNSGDLLIGNASGGLTKAPLTAGSNITITPGDGSITIAASAAAGYSAGDGLDLAGNEFSVDLKANGGLVIESGELAVDLGGPSITGTLGVADGGTGQSTYSDGQLLIGNSLGGLTRSTLSAGTNIGITNGNGSITVGLSGTVASGNGGTGQSTYANGQLLIGNNSGGLTKATLTAGAGISVTNGDGSITIAASAAGYTITTTAINKTLADRERCTVTAAGLTLTLPLDPTSGVEVSVTVAGTFTDTTIARNGQLIMGLSEDMIIDRTNVTVTLYFVDATRGWRII